ncbi:MAG: hypothetical protein AABZ23_01120 [Deltaproteobacteria bacterium]
MSNSNLELDVRLSKLKMFALKKIEEAARKGDSSVIITNTRIIEEAERLMKKLDEFKLSLDYLEKRGDSNILVDVIAVKKTESLKPSPDIDGYLTSRQKGKQSRALFLKKLRERNIHLNSSSAETIYTNKNGKMVGIAFATECQPFKWFLGLPERNYNVIVLLCEEQGNNTLSFILPADFCEKYKNNLSRSKGQLKFNVVNRHDSFFLLLSGLENPEITRYIDNYDSLE